jgi:predicted permease
VFLFTLAIAVIAGIGFGLTPALSTARTDFVTALKDGWQTSLRGYRRFGLRNLFVVYQVAVSLMLLLVTGFVVIGYQRTTGIDPGFETADLYLLSLDPARDGYSAERSAELLQSLPPRLAGLPTVRALTLAERAPASDMVAIPNIRVSTGAGGDGGEQVQHSVVRQRIGANYFAALGVPLLQGREFTAYDQQASSSAGAAPERETPVVINQTAARELFGGDNPLGGRIRQDKESYIVIGVARDVSSGLMMAKPQPTVNLPLTADHFGGAQAVTLLIRGMAGADTITAVRNEVAAIDSNLTLFNVRPMSEHLDQFNVVIRWSTMMNGGVAVFGMILASIGLAGVTAHAVARRRKEIGIRMALGAGAGQVLRLVMKESVVLVAVGAVLGFAGAVGLARVFSAITAQLAQIFAVGTGDPLLVIGGPLLLVTLALLASYLPARRATRIDPLSALREE